MAIPLLTGFGTSWNDFCMLRTTYFQPLSTLDLQSTPKNLCKPWIEKTGWILSTWFQLLQMSWQKYVLFFWIAQEMTAKIHRSLMIPEFRAITKKTRQDNNKIWLAVKLSEQQKSLGYTWWTDRWTVLICSLVFFLSTYLIWQSHLSVKQKQFSGMASLVFSTRAELNFWSNSVLW